MLTLFDIMLIAIAFLILVMGLSRRVSILRSGRTEARKGSWRGLFGYILGHSKIMENRKRGMVHLILFWGFLIPLIVIILAQFMFNLPLPASRILSFLLDLLGICLLLGTIYFFLMRIRSNDQGGPDRSLLPMFLMLIIVLSGFLAEGFRLSITNAEFMWSSPFGWLISRIVPDSPILMFSIIRVHFLAVLVFIAALPFTFSRHIFVAPLNVFYKRKGKYGELMGLPMDKGVVGAGNVKDFSWKQLLDAEACVACGRCEENCPAFISGKPLSPRKIIKDILEQMDELARGETGILTVHDEEIWSCSMCMACALHCPVFIEPMDKIVDMRRYRLMGKGLLPTEAISMIRNLEIFGDVQGSGKASRLEWVQELKAPLIHSEVSRQGFLLWVGCSGAFHPRYQEVARSMVNILNTAHVPFYILGKEETCCGDPARRLGEESLFLELAKKNIQILDDYGVEEIVCLCPHCFNTLKNEYLHINVETESTRDRRWKVYHASEYLLKLINEKRITPKYPLDKTLVYHDPCYLGRGNDLYEPPREIIQALPRSRLKELERHHGNGFCCGGGGGGMWLHENQGRRLNSIRAEEVIATGADLLVTACPYCQTMLDDGVKSLDPENVPKVMDIVEVLAYTL